MPHGNRYQEQSRISKLDEWKPSQNLSRRVRLIRNCESYIRDSSNNPREDTSNSRLDQIIGILSKQIEERGEGRVYRDVMISKNPRLHIARVDVVSIFHDPERNPVFIRINAYSPKAKEHTRQRKHQRIKNSLRLAADYINGKFDVNPRLVMVSEGQNNEISYQEISRTLDKK